MNEDKATRYHRLGRRAGILSALWTGAILVAFLLTGASAGLRDWAASLAGANPTLIVVLYVLVLSLAFDAATLPFSFYRGFLLERRYGLSTETMGHWLKDHAKAVLIGVLFAELGAVFVYFALRNWPAFWWAIAGVGYSLVAILVVSLAPVVLLPLFFTFKPLEKAALQGSSDGARVEGRHAHHGRVRVDAERSHEEGERRADGNGQHAAHSSFGHAARRILRRRDRSDSRARARAPCP